MEPFISKRGMPYSQCYHFYHFLINTVDHIVFCCLPCLNGLIRTIFLGFSAVEVKINIVNFQKSWISFDEAKLT